MEKSVWVRQAAAFVREAADNALSPEKALAPELAGMRIYDAPIFAFGAADDPWFERLREPAAVGPHFQLPSRWLPQAKTVISFFLPFSSAVRESNRGADAPSPAWLQSRLEGQAFLKRFVRHLAQTLEANGFAALVPGQDDRYWNTETAEEAAAHGAPCFTSNWSERHVAFVCGLGTFGLSGGLITAKGMAGRLGSIVTSWDVPPDVRGYTGPYDYCIRCGACVRRCPVHAVHPDAPKEHAPCKRFLDQTRKKFYPRYGCGKCQTAVPCESRIPVHRRDA